MNRPPDISSREWLSLIRRVRRQLAGADIKADDFMVNRILVNLWRAYEAGAREDPTLTRAVLDDNIEIVPR